MVARLDTFRSYFDRLDPAAAPDRALRDKLYVLPPGRAVGDQLAARFQLAPTSSHLVLGGLGAGKTTELIRASELLKATTDTRAVYVDVSRRHDLDQKLAGVIVVLAGLELSRLTKGNRATEVRAAQKKFSQWAYGHQEFVPYDPSDDYDYDMGSSVDGSDEEPGHYVKREGVLAQPLPPLPTASVERIEALRTLRQALPDGATHFVILVDSLDRLDDAEAFRAAVVGDVRTLRKAGIGIAVVGPGRIIYGPNRSTVDLFDQYHALPALDAADDSARAFLGSVLERRVGQEVLNAEMRDELVNCSGGLLRDLLGLTRSAVEEAFVANEDVVRIEHVTRAADHFGRSLMMGLRPAELATLQRLRRRGTFVPTSDDELALLMSRRVIEYPGVTTRFAVHPTIEPLLASLEPAK